MLHALMLLLSFQAPESFATGADSSAPGAAEFLFDTASFASCHASTIVELDDGGLMAAWFGGSAEGAADVAIWGARRTGGRWSTPVELVREKEIACYNPVLFHTHDGRLWLYYKFGPHPSQWTAGRLWSTDEGESWSAPEHLPAGLYGPIRTKPLVLDDGTIVSGTSVESYHSWACWIERSSDGGGHWTKSGPIVVDTAYTGNGRPRYTSPWADWDQTDGIIQPAVVSMGGSRLCFYARSTSRVGRICVAESRDRGVTWTAARPIDLPNPNSGIDAVRLADGRIVIAYNHAMTGRTPLNLGVSSDGETFRMFRVLESSPGEYSYPAMIVGRDGSIHLTYTWNRTRIRYVRLPPEAVPSER